MSQCYNIERGGAELFFFVILEQGGWLSIITGHLSYDKKARLSFDSSISHCIVSLGENSNANEIGHSSEQHFCAPVKRERNSIPGVVHFKWVHRTDDDTFCKINVLTSC